MNAKDNRRSKFSEKTMGARKTVQRLVSDMKAEMKFYNDQVNALNQLLARGELKSVKKVLEAEKL